MNPKPAALSPFVMFADPRKVRALILEQGTIKEFSERLDGSGEPRRKRYGGTRVSERTLQRAIRKEGSVDQRKVSAVGAEVIAGELGVTVDELGGVVSVQSDPDARLPSVKQIEAVMELAQQTVLSWLARGRDLHRAGEPDSQRMPVHPELVYRLGGEWKGWNHFLGTDGNAPEADTHRRIDALEDHLFELVGTVMHFANSQDREGAEE